MRGQGCRSTPSSTPANACYCSTACGARVRGVASSSLVTERCLYSRVLIIEEWIDGREEGRGVFSIEHSLRCEGVTVVSSYALTTEKILRVYKGRGPFEQWGDDPRAGQAVNWCCRARMLGAE